MRSTPINSCLTEMQGSETGVAEGKAVSCRNAQNHLRPKCNWPFLLLLLEHSVTNGVVHNHRPSNDCNGKCHVQRILPHRCLTHFPDLKIKCQTHEGLSFYIVELFPETWPQLESFELEKLCRHSLVVICSSRPTLIDAEFRVLIAHFTTLAVQVNPVQLIA